jgi:hypothetical protein
VPRPPSDFAEAPWDLPPEAFGRPEAPDARTAPALDPARFRTDVEDCLFLLREGALAPFEPPRLLDDAAEFLVVLRWVATVPSQLGYDVELPGAANCQS